MAKGYIVNRKKKSSYAKKEKEMHEKHAKEEVRAAKGYEEMAKKERGWWDDESEAKKYEEMARDEKGHAKIIRSMKH